MAINYTYDDNARREDLLGIITNLDYKENQLVSGLKTSEAQNIVHQWLTDTLKTVATNAAVEGADPSYPARTNPGRLSNHTQIVEVSYTISDTERAVNTAGFNDRYTYETTKAMKEWKQDTELALMRGSLICGTGSSGRQLQGIKNWFTGRNITSQSGVSLTESILNDYLQNVWDDGTEVDAIYAGAYIKRKISAFTAGTTKFTDAIDRRLVAAVDVYESDVAKLVKLFKHRYVTISGDANHDIVGVNEDMFRIAYLTGRKPNVYERAKTGDATKGQVLGELTLECLHQDAGFLGQRHL